MSNNKFKHVNESVNYKFARNVKFYRNGMTQERLADLCGLKPSAISNLESGRRKPLLTTAVKISKALGVDLDTMIK